MPAERILILAGTAEARALANALVAEGRDVISSFAGVTRDPLLPQGRIHTGGFGGAEGLIEFLRRETITAVVDATHPFAAQMSAHADAACAALSISLLRLERPAWVPEVVQAWQGASSMDEAVSLIPQGSRVLVTTGRKGLGKLLSREDLSGLIRTIEPPDEILPPQWAVLLDRPPHALPTELELMQRQSITCLLTKNAGGDATSAKLSAAAQLGATVVMIERPFKPPCATVSTVAEALLGIRRRAG